MAAAAALEGAAEVAPPAVEFFPFAALPPVLAHKIFAALPADTRLRCAEVCTAWCAAVAERSLWTRLDLSDTSGVTHEVTPALLRAAAAKARGALTALDVSDVWRPLFDDGVLREVLAANADTLRELRCLQGRDRRLSVPVTEALLSAAPQLRACEADLLFTSAAEARAALRNEGVFGPLRVACLGDSDEAATVAHVSLFADVAAHASLTELQLRSVPLDVPELLRAFVDAALSLPRLRAVQLSSGRLSPASAPALARLLRGGTLAELVVFHNCRPLLDAPSAALLGDALRASATLTSLTLHATQLWSDRGRGRRAAARADGARAAATAGHHERRASAHRGLRWRMPPRPRWRAAVRARRSRRAGADGAGRVGLLAVRRGAAPAARGAAGQRAPAGAGLL